MDKMRILLCCGGGFSTGILAKKALKAAKDQHIECTISAVSESQVKTYLNKIDVLLIGPHYASRLSQFEKIASENNFVAAVIPREVYGMVDGEKLLEQAINLYKKNH